MQTLYLSNISIAIQYAIIHINFDPIRFFIDLIKLCTWILVKKKKPMLNSELANDIQSPSTLTELFQLIMYQYLSKSYV